MPNGLPNPKNYPHWKELIELLKPGNEIIQIGVSGEECLVEDCRHNLSFPQLKQLVEEMDIFFSVDNFFPHMAYHYGKRGIVLWGTSDPALFGYKEHVNLFKDPKYFRPDQFGLWLYAANKPESFVEPASVIATLAKL